MNNLSDRKIVVITKQTRADELVKRFNNMAQAAFYIEKMGGDINEYIEVKYIRMQFPLWRCN